MNALGIVFSNINDKQVPEITENRIMASVPFGGRYRLIDFILSNMTNSGIIKTGIITKHNYQNLMDHLGTGKPWDLARKRGGIRLLQPHSGIDNHVDTLNGIAYYLDKASEEYVVLANCTTILNISYTDVLKAHKKSGADITVVYQKHEKEMQWKGNRIAFELDENHRVTNMKKKSHTKAGEALYLGTMIVRKDFLKLHVKLAADLGFTSLVDYWTAHRSDLNVQGYEFSEYYAHIDSLHSFMNSNLDLLDLQVREDLFRKPYRPIHTCVNDSQPTKYGPDAVVENSVIADGCIINGVVKNSVISRGVKIDKYAEVNNSVVMEGNSIGKYATLNHIVTDKNVIIGDHRVLSGHETHPFFIEKGCNI